MIEKMGQEGGWDMLLQVSLCWCSVVSEQIVDGWGMRLRLRGRGCMLCSALHFITSVQDAKAGCGLRFAPPWSICHPRNCD